MLCSIIYNICAHYLTVQFTLSLRPIYKSGEVTSKGCVATVGPTVIQSNSLWVSGTEIMIYWDDFSSHFLIVQPKSILLAFKVTTVLATRINKNSFPKLTSYISCKIATIMRNAWSNFFEIVIELIIVIMIN